MAKEFFQKQESFRQWYGEIALMMVIKIPFCNAQYACHLFLGQASECCNLIDLSAWYFSPCL